jgi:hypothetical protein
MWSEFPIVPFYPHYPPKTQNPNPDAGANGGGNGWARKPQAMFSRLAARGTTKSSAFITLYITIYLYIYTDI